MPNHDVQKRTKWNSGQRPKKSVADALKSYHRRSSSGESLKQFVRSSTDQKIKAMAEDWLFNKSCNFANMPQGIGATRKKKNKQGGGAPKAPKK
jgi:hypothetical protein